MIKHRCGAPCGWVGSDGAFLMLFIVIIVLKWCVYLHLCIVVLYICIVIKRNVMDAVTIMQRAKCKATYSQSDINAMRDWLKDCRWVEIEDESEFDVMPSLAIIKGVDRHYSGGLAEFMNCL